MEQPHRHHQDLPQGRTSSTDNVQLLALHGAVGIQRNFPLPENCTGSPGTDLVGYSPGYLDGQH